MKGFDCATPISTDALAKTFKAAGYEMACRYLVPNGYKRLTKEEAEILTANDFQILSVFETTADRALGGYSAGKSDGAVAALVAQDIGQPDGSCIYFAVDFDATEVQLPYVIEYLRGASEATPTYSTGVYGSYRVLNAIHDAGVCSHYWQTYAWSRGLRADFMNVYQYRNGVTEDGIDFEIDLNESYGNEGTWTLKEESTVPTWTDEQWNNFKDLLQDLYDKSTQDELDRWVLADYNYVQKAYDRTLTISETLYLLGVMFARSQRVKVD